MATTSLYLALEVTTFYVSLVFCQSICWAFISLCIVLQADLETAKSEIQKWHSAFRNESFVQPGTTPGTFSWLFYYFCTLLCQHLLGSLMQKLNTCYTRIRNDNHVVNDVTVCQV